MLTIFFLMGLLSISFYLVVRTRRPRRFLLADSFFLGLAIFFTGSVIAAYRLPLGGTGNTVVLIALFALVSGSLSSAFLRPYYRRLDPPKWHAPPLRAEFIMAATIFLVLFNFGFAFLVYIKLLHGSLAALADDGGLLSVRKMIASGEQGYFFPGLVKQVRDVFAPAFVYYLLAYSAPGKNRFSLLAVLVSTLVAMFFGGQRSSLLVLGIAAYLGKRKRTSQYGGRAQTRRHPVRLLIYGILCVAGMGAINQLLGRANVDSSLFEMIVDSGIGIFERIVVVVPISNIEAYDFVNSRNYGAGALWLDSLSGLLPGTQTGLANEMHEFLGGSFEGNAVLGFPISTYVNFGFVGLLLVPMCAMSLLTYFDRSCSRINSPLLASARMVMLVYLPIAYEPATFLLSGGLVFIAVFAWVYFLSSKGRLRDELG